MGKQRQMTLKQFIWHKGALLLQFKLPVLANDVQNKRQRNEAYLKPQIGTIQVILQCFVGSTYFLSECVSLFLVMHMLLHSQFIHYLAQFYIHSMIMNLS
jgi:hypothetical protein